MDKIKPLFTATATASGGRNGRTESSDGMVKVDLSVPKEMGGPGKPNTATPEHLFAAGYAACFHSALRVVGRTERADLTDSAVAAKIHFGALDGGEGYGLAAELEIALPALDRAAAEALMAKAHRICPYSNVTRGNMDVALTLVEFAA